MTTLAVTALIGSVVFGILRCVRSEQRQRGQVRPVRRSSTGRHSRRWFVFVSDDNTSNSDITPNERRPLLG